VSAVELGKRNGVEVQIDKGLAERDQVVLHPSDRITDGVKVEVR
jgi:HlyD family secretion protein